MNLQYKKKVAILLKGAVSRKSGKISYVHNNDYVNYYAQFLSLKKHLLDTNKDYSFDFFIHCWDFELEQKINQIYNPTLALYENNVEYKDKIIDILNKCQCDLQFYSQVSQCISIKNGIQLIEKNSILKDIKYEIIIIYRLDLLLWKNMYLNNYCDLNNIYVNKYEDCLGDFHFIMNFENAKQFANIVDNLSIKLKPLPHQFFKTYICKTMNKNLIMDDIEAGTHQEVIRKLKNVYQTHIFDEDLKNYDLLKEEIFSYNSY